MVRWANRAMLARILSAVFVHTKGFGAAPIRPAASTWLLVTQGVVDEFLTILDSGGHERHAS